MYHSLAPSLWYFVLAEIYERYCESSISWTFQVYKFICLLGVTLEKDQKTLLPAYDFAWF